MECMNIHSISCLGGSMKHLKEYVLPFVNILEFVIALCLIVGILLSIGNVIIYSSQTILAQEFRLEWFLSTILSIVVAIEFVKMLLLHTPESVLEVVLYAVARQVIISHDDALENLIGVLAVGIIFIIRKYFSKSFQGTEDDQCS